MNIYEFNVQIWEEDGKWHYGICQEFESENSQEFETLAYGEADSLQDAAVIAGREIHSLFDGQR